MIEIGRGQRAGRGRGVPAPGVVLQVDRCHAAAGHQATDDVHDDGRWFGAEQLLKSGDMRLVDRADVEADVGVAAFRGEARTPALRWPRPDYNHARACPLESGLVQPLDRLGIVGPGVRRLWIFGVRAEGLGRVRPADPVDRNRRAE